MKDQVRVLNENLKRESEQANYLGKDNVSLKEENIRIKSMFDETKTAAENYKTDSKQMNENLRMQLDETKVMIEKIKIDKDKQFRNLKEKYDEERRKEAEMYEF